MSGTATRSSVIQAGDLAITALHHVAKAHPDTDAEGLSLGTLIIVSSQTSNLKIFIPINKFPDPSDYN